MEKKDFTEQMKLLTTLVKDENGRLDGLLEGRRADANSSEAIFSDDDEANERTKSKKKKSKK